MKSICCIAALLPLAAWCAAAQGTPDELRVTLEKFIAQSKVYSTEGMLLNAAVKDAPYAADEVTQFSQTLGDGTHIQRETKVAVYRDGQGRVRRETPSEITIMDPVAGVSYSLNPKTMTGRKMTVSIVSHTDGSSSTMNVTVRSDDPASAEQKAKIEAERSMVVVTAGSAGAQGQGGGVFAPRRTTGSTADDSIKADLDAAAFGMVVKGNQRSYVYSTAPVTYNAANVGEPMAQQMVEGLLCDGTRSVETIGAGVIGNDKPIQTVNERWYSSELKTTVRTVRTDPRNGDETFRLTNIRRGEPSPGLFQVPAGYQIVGN